MEMRKVQVTGGSTFIISLPKRWARDVGIKANDTVGLVPQADGTLVVTPRLFAEDDLRRKVFNVSEETGDKELFRDLIGAYVTGFDLIEVYNRPRMSTSVRNLVRRFTQSVIGPEIIDESLDSIKTRDLLDPSDLPFKTSIRRMYRIVSSMHKSAALACEEKDIPLAEDVISRDVEVDRLHWLVARQYNLLIRDIELVEKIGTTREHAVNYLLISRILERIGDHSTRMAEQVEALSKVKVDRKVLRSVREFSESILSVLDDVITSLFERNAVLAHEAMSRADAVLRELEEFDERVSDLSGTVALPMSTIVDSIERTGNYTKDIAECVINFVIDSDANV